MTKIEDDDTEATPLVKTIASRRSYHRTAVIVTIFLLCTALTIGLILGLVVFADDEHFSATGHYSSAGVASDSICSKIGADVLRERGSVVDAAIATVLCSGLQNPHSTGVGGGDVMLIYERPRNGTERELAVLDSREVAPLAATSHMINNETVTDLNPALLTGVPGQLAGLYQAWLKFGRLPWKRLLQPAITMCENGFPVSQVLAEKIKSQQIIKKSSGLREILLKADGSLLREGDIMRRPELSATLQAVADHGPSVLYSGTIADSFVQDIREHGGVITLDDLNEYQPIWRQAATSSLWGRPVTMVSSPPPFGGDTLQFILQLMSRYRYNTTMPETTDAMVLFYHRMLESVKFGKALQTYMGDPVFDNISDVVANLTSPSFQDFTFRRIDDNHTHNVSYYNPYIKSGSDRGTSHTSIIGPDGAAVGITSTINTIFGAKVRGKRTGIILNNEMEDFVYNIPSGTEASGPNVIRPGKRPASSMSPLFLLDKDGNVMLVMGGSGGSKIPSIMSLIMSLTTFLGVPLNEAIDRPHIHAALLPLNIVSVEKGFPEDVIKGLRQKGHVISPPTSDALSIEQGMLSECHKTDHEPYCLTAICDWRKQGVPDGF